LDIFPAQNLVKKWEKSFLLKLFPPPSTGLITVQSTPLKIKDSVDLAGPLPRVAQWKVSTKSPTVLSARLLNNSLSAASHYALDATVETLPQFSTDTPKLTRCTSNLNGLTPQQTEPALFPELLPTSKQQDLSLLP
jgi:hypothetical protein